jgi:hypothetical protein
MNDEVKPMDCARFEKIVHDLDRPGTEGYALRESALAHAESCSQCAQLMTVTESLDAALRTLAGREDEQQAPARVGAALMEEFRRQRTSSSRRRVQWQIAALSTAAVLLLALGFSMHYWPRHDSEMRPLTKIAANTPAAPAVSPIAAPAGSQQLGDTSESQTDDSEYATDFVPLPYADDQTAVDGGMVVRVVLSRPALASLGVPITDPGATDQIPVDLLLSQDGAPQAIRLVSQASLDD